MHIYVQAAQSHVCSSRLGVAPYSGRMFIGLIPLGSGNVQRRFYRRSSVNILFAERIKSNLMLTITIITMPIRYDLSIFRSAKNN